MFYFLFFFLKNNTAYCSWCWCGVCNSSFMTTMSCSREKMYIVLCNNNRLSFTFLTFQWINKKRGCCRNCCKSRLTNNLSHPGKECCLWLLRLSFCFFFSSELLFSFLFCSFFSSISCSENTLDRTICVLVIKSTIKQLFFHQIKTLFHA